MTRLNLFGLYLFIAGSFIVLGTLLFRHIFVFTGFPYGPTIFITSSLMLVALILGAPALLSPSKTRLFYVGLSVVVASLILLLIIMATLGIDQASLLIAVTIPALVIFGLNLMAISTIAGSR